MQGPTAPARATCSHVRLRAVMATVLVAVVVASCTPDPSSREAGGTAASQSPREPTPVAASPSPESSGSRASGRGTNRPSLEVLGHHALGGDGYNADVYALGDFAYVGDMGHDPTPAYRARLME